MSADEPGREEMPPMLVIGDDLPDVEDTTAEELARQRAELEERRRHLEEEDRRRREEAERRAEQLRREAEQKLARERREAEIELARRQREIDDAERRLERNRRRLAKQGGSAAASSSGATTATGSRPQKRRKKSRDEDDGNSLLAAVDRRSGTPVPKLGRASVLAVLAGALIALGAPLSIDPPPGEAVADFVAQDETRTGWVETGLALDQDVVDYLAGEDVVVDGEVPSVTRARAVADPGDYYLDGFVDQVGPLLQEPGSTPQRVLSAWSEARNSTLYGVSTYDVKREAEQLDTDRVFPTLMLLGAMVAMGGLALGLARGGTWVGAGLAGLGLVSAGLLVANGDRHLDVEPAIEQHDAAMGGSEGLHQQLERDLGVVLGSRSLESYERDDYWERISRVSPDEVDPAVLEGYEAARRGLEGVDLRSMSLEESLPHAEALIEAGGAALAAQHEQVEQARAEVVAHTEPDVDLGPYLATALAAGLLPLAALVPAAVRRQRVGG